MSKDEQIQEVKVEILELDDTITITFGSKYTEWQSKDGKIYYTWIGGGVCNPLEEEAIKVNIYRWYPAWLVGWIIRYNIWKKRRKHPLFR